MYEVTEQLPPPHPAHPSPKSSVLTKLTLWIGVDSTRTCQNLFDMMSRVVLDCLSFVIDRYRTLLFIRFLVQAYPFGVYTYYRVGLCEYV